MNGKVALVFLASFFCAMVVTWDSAAGTLSKSDRVKKKAIKEPQDQENSLFYEDVLLNYHRIDYREHKKYRNTVLGYVTPWNNHGYDIAKSLAHKFDFISPVWFQVVSSPNGCQINGVHDLDQGWISDVRKNNSMVKIVPRFVFEKWNFNNFNVLVSNEDFQSRCITSMLEFMQRNRFDGAVIEGIFQIHWMLFGETTKNVLMMMWNIAEMFKAKHMLSILVIPASLDENNAVSQFFSPHHFRQLVPYFDYFSVMMYDFPSPKISPVAPIYWVKACIEILIKEEPNSTSKLLMGLNFYGYDYDLPRADFVAVVGSRYVELLEKYKPNILWNKAGAEHYFSYDGHTVYYPSLSSIEARLTLAEELGVGVAIWETGQGLDYFYNLF